MRHRLHRDNEGVVHWVSEGWNANAWVVTACSRDVESRGIDNVPTCLKCVLL